MADTQVPYVLLVEDTLSLARTYQAYLKDEAIELVHVETGKEAIEAIAERVPDALLLDLVLPDMNGIEILKGICDKELSTATIVITAHGSVNTAIDAMRYGAFDFLSKPFSADRLRVTLKNALQTRRLEEIVEIYKRDIDRHEYCGFIGGSLAMQAVYRTIDSAASSKATVFITGESGTGKEVCAEAVHRQSPRKNSPFIAINCGAIPKDLMESEIFGHTKGSFTGAVANRDGAARRADGGTLFLDEICEMDLDLQTKLLRFVQTGTFQKVGGSEMEAVNIRIICATNRDPLVEVAAGRFREDLFYRLHVIPVHMPPLRERDGDVLDIAAHFLDQFAGEEGKQFVGFSDEVKGIFGSYPWPGNVRQLQNVVRNIVVLNEGDEVSKGMLPAPLDAHGAAAGGVHQVAQVISEDSGGGKSSVVVQEFSLPHADSIEDIRPLEDVEREIIERAIKLCDGNIPQAASRLGISASTIYRKRTTWDEKKTRAAS